MFFNLAWRNSKRSRNENLIYFLTMVTAVAAFYIWFGTKITPTIPGKPSITMYAICGKS